MPYLNEVVLQGHLTSKPTVTATTSGLMIYNYTIAVNRSWKDKTGDWNKEASYIDCKSFKENTTLDHSDTGDLIQVVGSLRQERWQTQDGSNRSKLVVYPHKVQSLTYWANRFNKQETDQATDDLDYHEAIVDDGSLPF